MLRVLTLSTLFPNAAQPTLGNFVERQTLELAARDDVEVQVVSAVGIPPWPLSVLPYYAARAGLRVEEQWKGLRVFRPRFTKLPRISERWTAHLMARALLPLLRRTRERFPFDIIDAEFFWPDGPAAMLLAQQLNVPFSVKARGADIQYWGGRQGIGEQIVEAGRKAHSLLAVSAALRDVMVELGMPRQKIQVHRTGVDLDKFRPVDRAAAKASLGVEGPLIVTAGALIERKRQRLAVETLEQLPEATMILVGDGPDRKKLEQFIRSRGLAHRVQMLGNRPHDELPALLGAADVMLLPSRSEGLANVWVEALACGTPIVIGDIGGAREVLDRPEAGTTAPFEPKALANAVRAIIGAPPDPQVVRGAAEKFSWKANSDGLYGALSEACRGRRP